MTLNTLHHLTPTLRLRAIHERNFAIFSFSGVIDQKGES
jgi:hypothetical protein